MHLFHKHHKHVKLIAIWTRLNQLIFKDIYNFTFCFYLIYVILLPTTTDKLGAMVEEFVVKFIVNFQIQIQGNNEPLTISISVISSQISFLSFGDVET